MQNCFQKILIVTLLVVVPAIRAQSVDEPEKLTAMRAIYEAEVVKLKVPVLRKLAADLSALELQLTRANKLEEAVKARKARARVEANLKSLGAKRSATRKSSVAKTAKAPAAEMKEFSIPMDSASLQGRLKRPRSGAYITNWVTTTCLATWSGGEIVPGLYDVYIDFDTHYLRGGGELKFEELGQDFHCVIPAETARTQMKVGTFKLGTALGFTIRSMSKNPYGVLRLRGVTFTPSEQQ